MSSLPAHYTPLESLLLFQSLACYGVEASVFAKVSDLLLRNDAVKNAATFSPDRLTPDALRDLYLHLLKEEIRDELDPRSENEPPVQNGDSPSRKRKAPSPSLPSVQEAAQHQHLLPQLIAKLYTRYRRHAVDEIREHENRYDHFSRELRAIQSGEWDERLQREHQVNGARDAAHVPPAAAPASTPAVAQPPPEDAPRDAQGPVKAPATAAQASPPSSKEESPTAQQMQAPRRSSAKIESIINHPSETPSNGSASPHLNATTESQSPIQSQAQPQTAPHQRTLSHPQLAQQQQQQQHARGPAPPPPPPPHQPPHGGQFTSPYGPPHTSPAGSSQSPTAHNVAIPSRPPQGPPVILPPPPNMQNTQYPTPPLQVPPMQEGNRPFNRPLSGSPHQHARPFPPGPAPPGPGPHSPSAHHPPHVQQQQPGFYPQYPPGQHPYPHNQPMYPPHAQPPMPPRGGGGVIMEPFQVNPQDPVEAHKAQERQMRQQQAQAARPPSVRPQPSPRNAAATPVRPQQVPPYHPSPGQPPLYPHPSPAPALRRPTLHVNTRFSSWKHPLPQHRQYPEWNPPEISPLSPERSPELPSSAPPSSTSKSKRAVKSKEMPAPDAAETPKPGKGSRKGARKVRGTSVASSAVTGSGRGRTRSQSVASHADETGPDVKAEPSTPAETMESDAQSTTETPTSGGRRTRRRAGTLQSVLEQSQPVNNKRKRDQREESDTAEPDIPDIDIDLGTPGPPTFVIASRNFGRMSVPVMNDITSHKHASLFSHPVKPKDAEGYYDIIRRPQDLKSIRTAITNGSRAVAAATQSTADNTPSANSPGGGGPATPTTQMMMMMTSATSTHITLPISEELLPPRGIVNSAQLERELMRMFANAVMFNSGEDGVVSDAVEMAKDVEASVANWRTAERTSVYEATSNAAASAAASAAAAMAACGAAAGGGGGGGTPGEGEEMEVGGKRRKV